MVVVGHFLLLDQRLWLRFDFGFDFSFSFDFSFDFIYSSISFTVSLALFFCCFLCCRFCCFFYYFCHTFFVIFFLLLDGAFSLLLPCLRLVLILDEWNNFYWFQILTLFYTRSSPRVGACRYGCMCVCVWLYVCVRIAALVFVLFPLYAYLAVRQKKYKTPPKRTAFVTPSTRQLYPSPAPTLANNKMRQILYDDAIVKSSCAFVFVSQCRSERRNCADQCVAQCGEFSSPHCNSTCLLER